MAIRWIEGFDLYSSTINMQSRGYTGNAGSYVGGRFAGSAGRYNSARSGFSPFGGSTSSTLSHGFAFRAQGLTNFTIVNYMNGSVSGSTEVELRMTTTGAVQATRNGTVLGTSAAGVIATSTWAYIEVEIVRHASAGVFNIYVNGTSVLALTAQNTGSADIDTLYLCHNGGSNNGLDYDLDDMYVTDTSTRIGESRVDTLRPSADTAQKDWTPNSGANNYSRVGDTTYDGDTSYIGASTVGNKDLYDCTDLPVTPASVYAVQVSMAARKDDAATRQVRTNLKSGSATQNGTTQGMSATYQIFSDIYETDPNTSAAWTASAVNAAQVGVEVVT
jgi:hypothetical protein